MGCNCNQPAPCNQPPVLCECPTILKSDCVIFSGNDLPCSGITTGQTLTETVEQLDTFICEKVNDITNAQTLKNIGTGSEVYKGTDLLGRKEIRKINATGSLAKVTQNTNDISVTIDETALNAFVEANQKTYTLANVGAGAQVYKDSTVVGDNTQYNVRTVVKEDLGTGASFLRDIQQNTNELNVRVKTLVSNNLTITSTDNEVRIETPTTASIPALYVNNLYEPTYSDWLTENKIQNGGTAVLGFIFRGKGTLAQPFTDSTVYPLAGGLPTTTINTAIQNALDGDLLYSYVGSGTRLSPAKLGQKIIIQDNNGQYNFSGNFSYSGLNIEIEAIVIHTSIDMIVDMDNVLYFNTIQDSVKISIGEGYTLTSYGEGFNNSGSNVATNNYVNTKAINLLGKGVIYFPSSDITNYIINADIIGTGNNNDGGVVFNIECNLVADLQGILKIGGVARVYNYAELQSGTSLTVNPSLKAFLLLGGQFKSFKTAVILFGGGNRDDGFIFTPTGGFAPQLIGQSTTLISPGIVTNLFNKTNNNVANLIFINSDSSVLFNVTNIFESTNLWNVSFDKNIFGTGIIDATKADLTNSNTTSVTNSIGGNLIENLRVYSNRAAALLAGMPIYSAYIKTNGNAYPSTSTWVRDIVLPA